MEYIHVLYTKAAQGTDLVHKESNKDEMRKWLSKLSFQVESPRQHTSYLVPQPNNNMVEPRSSPFQMSLRYCLFFAY